MRLAVLPEFGEWSASTRYRASQHVPGLREHFDEVDLLLPDDRPRRRPGRVGQAAFFAEHGVRYIKRWRELGRVLEDYDAVMVQRALYPLGPGQVAAPVEHFQGSVLLDLDDAVFDVKPSLAERGRAAQWLYGPQQSQRILARADSVVVSTPNLLRVAAGKDVPVRVLPTVLDPTRYRLTVHGTRPTARIVWAGTTGGLNYLDPLRQILARLRDAGTGTLTVVSSAPWPGPADFRTWSLAEEANVFAEYDIGIMPLPDTPYTQGKAGFKLLQYMASGLAVVASPVGVNEGLVRESGGGLLATTPEEWGWALSTLLADESERQAMGERGRAFVERYCDLSGQAADLADLLLSRS